MTLYLLEALRPGGLVDAFYSALNHLGALSRSDLDWDGGRILQSWAAVRPYLAAVATGLALDDDEAALVSETLAYEDQRVKFAGPHRAGAHSESLEFRSGVDIRELIRRIQKGDALDDSLLRKTQIIFQGSEVGGFSCFAA